MNQIDHLHAHLGLAADGAGAELARAHGVALQVLSLTHENLREAITPCVGNGDFVLNLSVDVGSIALIALCRELGALYVDTCIEPWLGGTVDRNQPPAKRSNDALREAAPALRGASDEAPTAVRTHAANPGLVSHFDKQALLDIATDIGLPHEVPTQREGWARLAQRLHVRVIHIAERDTQVAPPRKVPGEFVNTWSVDAFVSEASQPAELGRGSQERHFPTDAAQHADGSHATIYLQRPGATTRVRTWTPLSGPQHAFLITHGESISIADHLTLGDPLQPDHRIGQRCTTPTTPATMRCCRCTTWRAAKAGFNPPRAW